jgi:PIN domain nuclease of toxin-antitoxin system
MKILLDTHAFVWYYDGYNNLSGNARKALDDLDNQYYVSIVCLWEIAIKWSLGKMQINAPSFDAFCEDVLSNGYVILDVELFHIRRLSKLAFYHRDPFDRLLISQALSEDMAIITKDSWFNLYTVENLKIIW